MYDVIIVGTGPSGTAAALELQDKKVLILDVGVKPPPNNKLTGNIFDLRQKDKNQFDYLIGKEFESLANISSTDLVSVKLKAPYLSFVVRDRFKFFDIKTQNFSPFISYAYGGLANAWGGGVYIFTDEDLSGFPITHADLAPYYDKVTRHIGISGTEDELTPILGSSRFLQKELQLSANAQDLLSVYRRYRRLFHRKGLALGQARAAALTEELPGRTPCAYDNTGYFTSDVSYLYTPPLTLGPLLAEKDNITLKTGFFVESFKDSARGVTVQAQDIATGEMVAFKGKKLLLAAGTIGTGRIVLSSFQDYTAEMPILDNPFSITPFLNIRKIGARFDKYGHEGNQLNLLYSGPLWPERVQGSVASYISPLRGDVFFDFPLSFTGNMACTRYLIPAITLLLLFYPDAPKPGNYLKLLDPKTLYIQYADVQSLGAVERLVIRLFSRLGFYSLPSLTRSLTPGNGIHYAGTVPMGKDSYKYQVDEECRLHQCRNVHLVDGSVLPRLPAKNLTLTLMANAMRVAGIVKEKV